MQNKSITFFISCLFLAISCSSNNSMTVIKAEYLEHIRPTGFGIVNYPKGKLLINIRYIYKNKRLIEYDLPHDEGYAVASESEVEDFYTHYETLQCKEANIYVQGDTLFFFKDIYQIEGVHLDSTFAKMKDSNAYVIIVGKIPPKNLK